MADFPLVDVHIHLYPTSQSAHYSLDGYDIWEYGDKPGVEFTRGSGLVEDMITCVADRRLDHGIVVNLVARDVLRGEAIAALDEALEPDETAHAIAAIDASIGSLLRASNEWLVRSLETVPELTPFVGVDPTILPAETTIDHMLDMARLGARGVKLHPVLQAFNAADPRMLPVYHACVDAKLIVLAHSGRTDGPEQLADPAAFAEVMRQVPELDLVLAHLGGGSWRDTAAFAREFPSVNFDLSEIVHWIGASGGPTAAQLADLILEVGPHRVMLGTDYPWYDLASTLEAVMAIPRLSDDEKRGIAGANAVRILRLTGF